jgi:hypothetical protein
MEEIKSVRVRNILEGTVIFQGIDLSGSQFDIKVTIYRDGKKRSLIGFNSNGNKAWDKIEFRDRGRYSNYTDDELILEYIETNSKLKNSNFGIIQDPWLEKPPKERSFGSDPYYLNNGAIIEIKWEQGGFQVFGKSWSDLDGNELNIERGQTQSSKGFINKTAKVLAPDSYEGENLNYTSLGLKSVSENIESLVSIGTVSDKDIINQIISQWKSVIPNYDKLELCEPDNERCELIDFISPVDPLEESLPEEDNKLVSEDPISDDKISLSFQIDSNISIRPREDFDFKLFIGEPPVDPLLEGFDFGDEEVDLSLLDEEFTEAEFDAEEESPSTIPEVEKELDSKNQGSIENNFEPGTYTPGTIANLPRGKQSYSHTKDQGFNLLNSQWIGNLVDSAKSHLETPTFDVDGTESGNLGCAAAVSIIFYRAFGVHLKTGKPVKEKPSSLGDFGSLGTFQLSEWFQNNSLYRQIPWKESKPGDIINTARNFDPKKAGHIGIVIDEIDPKTGTYFIISNSSGGFGNSSDPLGCVKKNYTIKGWQSVTDRNPTKTFSYRYIGPSLAKPIS